MTAKEIVNNPEVIPRETTLRDWVMRGYISRKVGYRNKGRAGGRVGLYEETLPVEIAVIAELKGTYRLQSIKGIKDQVIDVLQRVGLSGLTSEEVPDSGQLKNMEMTTIEDPELNEIVSKMLSEKAIDFEKASLIFNYLKAYQKYARRLQELENQQQGVKAK